MSDQDKDIDRALDAWTPMEPPADFVDRVTAARVPATQRSKRAWWLAAPVAAAAMIVIVLFALSSSRKDAAEGRNSAAQPSLSVVTNGTPGEQIAVGSGSSAGVAMNQPSVDAGVATTQLPITMASSYVAITAGTSATVHDLAPTTAVQIDFGARCPTGATVTAFRERSGSVNGSTATATGQPHVVLELDHGTWKYEVWCEHASDTLAAEGTIRVLRGDGRRKVPEQPRLEDIVADGRTWTVVYQARVPELRVRVPKGATNVTIRKDGSVVETIDVDVGSVSIPEGDLRDGTYTLDLQPSNPAWKPTTLVIDYDDDAPVIEIGKLVQTASGVKIRGQLQRDWDVSINGTRAMLLKDRSFQGDVGFGALVLHAKHVAHDPHFVVLPAVSR